MRFKVGDVVCTVGSTTPVVVYKVNEFSRNPYILQYAEGYVGNCDWAEDELYVPLVNKYENKSNGDDHATLTKYHKEKTAGDALKVILLQCYDLAFEHNLQVYEIKALVSALIDEHIIETEEEENEE
jgi:hypothetical protein